MAGFRDTNCYSLIFPDRLHQCAKGVGARLVDLAQARLQSSRKIDDAEDRLSMARSFCGSKLPTGLFEGRMTASELAFLLRCLPAVLVGIDPPMVHLCSGAAAFPTVCMAT